MVTATNRIGAALKRLGGHMAPEPLADKALEDVRAQLLTRIGPVPCGRSPSLMMPRRLATSV
jgi:hypothetical protein